jgi:hypothetical protein
LKKRHEAKKNRTIDSLCIEKFPKEELLKDSWNSKRGRKRWRQISISEKKINNLNSRRTEWAKMMEEER